MKKVFIFLLLLLISAGCNNVEAGEAKYYEMTNTIINNPKETKITNLNIEIIKHNSEDNKYLYEIIITNPKIQFDDLKIIALPKEYNFDELLPNFNVLEQIDIKEFNNKNQAIKLNFFSQNNYQSFKILIEYKNNNQQIQEVSNYQVTE